MSTNMLNISKGEAWLVVLCVCLAVRDLIRKWIALYRAWQKNDPVWFVFIFIFNTCGILPIIYLILNKKERH